MKKKKWMRVPFIDNYIEASTSGKIRDGETKNIIQVYKRKAGYEQFAAKINGEIKTTYVHRCVLAAHGIIDGYENLDVHHKDHNPSNNKLSNLVWCTPRQNALYSLEDGRLEYSKQKASENARNQLKNGTHAFFNLTPEQHRLKYINRSNNYKKNGNHFNKGKFGFKGTNVKMTIEKLELIKNMFANKKKIREVIEATGFSKSTVLGVKYGTKKY